MLTVYLAIFYLREWWFKINSYFLGQVSWGIHKSNLERDRCNGCRSDHYQYQTQSVIDSVSSYWSSVLKWLQHTKESAGWTRCRPLCSLKELNLVSNKVCEQLFTMQIHLLQDFFKVNK